MFNTMYLDYDKLIQILQKCCDDPDIMFVESNICRDKRLCCKHCGLVVTSLDSMVDLCNKWDDAVMESKTSKVEAIEGGVNKYPFVFAMK